MFKSISGRVQHATLAASVFALALIPGLSMAAAGDGVTEIGEAQTKALAVASALVGMGFAVWGVMYLYRKFGK